MLRLAVFAAAVALGSGPAAAQFDPVSGAATAAFLRDNGPWGLIAVCFSIIWLLWRQNQALIATANVLRDRRGDEADARAERFASVSERSLAASEKLAGAVAGVDDKLGDALDVIKLQPAANEAVIKALDRNAALVDEALNHLPGPAAPPVRRGRA